MTRKDSEKDSDRPHYYSQFWLDVAAGRRTIGGPRPEDDELLDDEPLAPIASAPPVAPATSRRASRNGQEHSSAFDELPEQQDEYVAPPVRSTVEPLAVQDEIGEPEAEQEPEEGDFTPDTIGDLDLQEAAVEDSDIPDMDLESLEDEDEGEDEDFYDEEEEDDDWSGGSRGRKKPKPSRPIKQPTKRTPRRDTRRGGY